MPCPALPLPHTSLSAACPRGMRMMMYARPVSTASLRGSGRRSYTCQQGKGSSTRGGTGEEPVHSTGAEGLTMAVTRGAKRVGPAAQQRPVGSRAPHPRATGVRMGMQSSLSAACCAPHPVHSGHVFAWCTCFLPPLSSSPLTQRPCSFVPLFSFLLPLSFPPPPTYFPMCNNTFTTHSRC